MEAVVTTPTSAATTSSLWRSRTGMTLIEILVVMGVLAALVVLGAQRIRRSENNIKATARQFMVLGKEIRNQARLTNKAHRLVIELDPAEPKYWVEIVNQGRGLIDPEARPKEESFRGDEEDAPPPEWSQSEKILKNKKELPTGLYFGSVETLHMKSPVTEGTAYVHFFPEGLMEAAAIQITDRDRTTWTLIYNPLTGQAEVAQTAKSLKDASR